MENKQLKPCPFCGGVVEFHSIRSKYNKKLYFAVCKNCGCETGGRHSINEAIEAWNRRSGK